MAVEAKAGEIAELCRRFGKSRQTGYEVLERHRQEGYEGLTSMGGWGGRQLMPRGMELVVTE